MFFILESFSIFIAILNDPEKKDRFLTSANTVSGFVYEYFNKIPQYFLLTEKNLELQEQNTLLLNKLNSSYKKEGNRFYLPTNDGFQPYSYTVHIINDTTVEYRIESHNRPPIQLTDSIIEDSTTVQTNNSTNIICKKNILNDTVRRYFYTQARVIKNSINKQYNYFTIDKGENDGIKPDMAVISYNGVAGIVHSTSEHYSTVISILNTKIGISAKIRKNEYFGSVIWNAKDYKKVILREIPNHVKLVIGDTVVTSGYSSIFPEGVPIGEISGFSGTSGGNFFEIEVKLLTNFKSLTYVYIVGNLLKEEQLNLEENKQND